ncbi:MAG: DUF5103 domain-containing protein [Melioribacteraceae bacterium]|nr:DUF5103 domain-containing protein [Melioribacteraceae bacterium]
MKKTLLFIFVLSSMVFARGVEIKGIKTYTSKSTTSLPVLVKDSKLSTKIIIEFDVIADSEPYLAIKFEFCDKNWVPLESIFFDNTGQNIDDFVVLEPVHLSTSDIDFHYKSGFPNPRVSFPFSGKWIYTIVDKFSEEIYGEGRFFVVDPQLGLSMKLSNESVEAPSIDNDVPDRSLKLEVSGTYPDSFFPSNLQDAEIITNHLTDYPKIITVDDNGVYNYFETDASNRFSFISRDVFPGNEYRRLDIRNHNKFEAPATDHKFGDIDITRIFNAGRPDLNGGSSIIKYDNRYAEYLDVTFRFDVPSQYEEDIYLIGSFNDWTPIEMYKDEGIYKAVVNIKRGVYDYQYLKLVDEENNIFDWFLFEGNFWETKNDYHVFIYAYSDEFGGYDKIIGYIKN